MRILRCLTRIRCGRRKVACCCARKARQMAMMALRPKSA